MTQTPGHGQLCDTVLIRRVASDAVSGTGLCSMESQPRKFCCRLMHAQDAQQATQQQRSLVVAIDDSDEGYAAVGWVLQHLWRPGDVLHLLHVVPALPPHMSYSLAPGKATCRTFCWCITPYWRYITFAGARYWRSTCLIVCIRSNL